MTLGAFDALGVGVSVQLGDTRTLALAETLMIDFEKEGLALIEIAGRGSAPVVEEGAAQPLGVRFSDKTTRGGTRREDPAHFQHLQLFRIAAGAEDLQFVADLIDLG